LQQVLWITCFCYGVVFLFSLEKSSLFGLDYLLQLLLVIPHCVFCLLHGRHPSPCSISLQKYVHNQLKRYGVLEFQISKKALFFQV
jgi:hypothetical protein